MKKVYGRSRIASLIVEYGHMVNDENITEFQDVIDSDDDANIRLTPGNWFHRDDSSGRLWLHSNASFGYGGRGTDVLAEIV